MWTDLKALSPQARVWIYQADRLLSATEAEAIEQELRNFVQQWTTHGTPVPAFGTVYHQAFVVLIADIPTSGCSIDSSVHLLKNIEQQYQISLFNRLLTAYFAAGQLFIVGKKQLQQALQSGQITLQTPVFNNLVQTKADWETQWQIPLGNSWLKGQL